jgi:hypothetical protein
MKIKILFIALLISSLSWGQTIYLDNFGTTAVTTKPYTGTPTTLDTNLSASSWTTSAAVFGGLAGNGGNPSQSLSLSNSSGTPTITLTFNVAAGYQMSVAQFNLWRVRSATGAQNWSLTINGTAVGSGTTPTAGATLGATNVSSPITNLTGTITVVLTVSGASGSGTFRLDDFTLIGTVTPTCTPAANPNGSISLFSSTCGTTTLSYSGSDAATCIWQTTSLGTNTGGTIASTNLVVNSSGTYYVRNYAGSCWSATDVSSAVTVSKDPALTSSPSTVSITETSNTSFSVAHTNTATYQWQVDDGVSVVTVNNGGVYSGATTATLTLTNVPLSMNGYIYKCIIYGIAPCTGFDISSTATLTVTPLYSSASDLLYVAGSSVTTISSTMNDASPLSSATGVQAMQFLLRDGGGTIDADALATTLTGFTIAQVSNTATDWSAAIKTIALFDGSTYVANGTISASTVVFSGLSVAVADGGSKTLSLRMSLNCPLGTVSDGEYFGFSIANGSTTVLASGSHMTTFTAVKNAPGAGSTLKIDVAATKLSFTTQPANTGLNNTMSTVVVKATDACGNVDTGFMGTVSLTSTGTMNAVTPIAMTAGVATFTTIVHTVIGTGYTLTASASGVTNGVSSTFNITAVTIFSEGDFAVVGLNANIATCNGGYTSGDDEISFITFKDIQNGDVFYITDNGYEKATAGLWGDVEGIYQITRNGSTLVAGTVITFRFIATAALVEFNSPDTSWSVVKASGFAGTVNMNTGGDQIFFMQGGAWTNPGGANDATYTPGTLLYAFNTNTSWTSLANSTQQSGLPLALRCFNMIPGSATDYIEYTGPVTAAEKFDWIIRLNNPSNWTNRGSCAGYLRTHVGQAYTISPDTYVNGVWTGTKSTDWFDCGNWQTLKVPTATTNVNVNATYATKDAIIDVITNATNAAYYSNQAKCKDLSISSRKVQLEASSSNTLDVNGNLSITSSGSIDMDDSSSVTADGQINLYGNWTNSVGNTAFSEGNGTVQFLGSSSQVISSVAAEGTEVFYNVVLDNNFDTAVSNDLIASGDLTIKTGRTVSIDSNGFIKAYNKLDHSGTLTIEDNGQFIQVNETDTNVGTYNSTTFKVKRNADVNQNDYVYWSSPTNAFDETNILSNGMRLLWNTTYPNADTQGNWNFASTEAGYPAMTKGKGYAICVPNSSPARPTAATSMLTTFTGKPNNGQFTFPITKGTITADFTNAAGVLTTKYDDNWNLVGNPYPSAIDAETFLNLNTAAIEGTVWIWKHGQAPTSTTNPFYQNFTYNYYSSDYCKYNKLGATDTDFAGKIGSGQGFMVNMLDSFVGSGTTITFNNSLRSNAASVTNPYTPYDNTDFYRTANNNIDALGTIEEKSRIWMDIFNNASNQTDTTLLGYSTNSTLERDHFYDAIFVPRNSVSFYSLIDAETFIIQGRPLPFDKEDKVPMGINIVEAGAHTIAIKKIDGIFVDDIPVYLEDKLLNIIHDLKQAPYIFNSEKGIFNNRFVLRYTNESLGNDDFDLDHNVVVSTHHGEMTINSYIENLAEVTVYDILGRQLLEAKNIANTVFVTSNISTSQQALLVKIKLANGTIVTRKIIL